MNPIRLVTASLLLAAGASLAQTVDPDDLPGHVLLPPGKVIRHKAPALQARLQALLDEMLALPRLAAPRGISVHSGFHVRRDPTTGMSQGTLNVILKPLFRRSALTAQTPAGTRYYSDGEGNVLELAINDLARLQIDPERPDAMHYRPQRVGEHQGQPVYSINGGGPLLVLAAPGRPLWLPVSVGEYLDAQLHSGEPAAPLLALKASLDPAQQRAPACVPTRRGQLVGRCDEPDATELVRWNPAYFDTRRPDAAQLITVKVGHMRQQDTRARFRVEHPLAPWSQAMAVLDDIDWQRVAAAVG